MIIDGNRIEPAEGMWLTNGFVWSKLVFLGIYDSHENWREATQLEYDETNKPVEVFDDDATIEDYENALGRFGV